MLLFYTCEQYVKTCTWKPPDWLTVGEKCSKVAGCGLHHLNVQNNTKVRVSVFAAEWLYFKTKRAVKYFSRALVEYINRYTVLKDSKKDYALPYVHICV